MPSWRSTTIDWDIVYSSMLSLLVHLVDGTQPVRESLTSLKWDKLTAD